MLFAVMNLQTLFCGISCFTTLFTTLERFDTRMRQQVDLQVALVYKMFSAVITHDLWFVSPLVNNLDMLAMASRGCKHFITFDTSNVVVHWIIVAL